VLPNKAVAVHCTTGRRLNIWDKYTITVLANASPLTTKETVTRLTMTYRLTAAQIFLRALALASCWLLAMNSASAQTDRFEDLSLNGISPYIQLRNEYYMGALYQEYTSADADTLLNADSIQRMQLRITIDRWSPRRFARQWNQLILINNEQATINTFANQILAFIDMPKEELIAGDIINIDRDPELGTSVYLNDSKVLHVANNDFFTLLLSTWIGQRPPSSDFKNNLLTLTSDSANTEQLKRFQRLKPTSIRAKTVAGWFKSKPNKTNNEPAVVSEQAPTGISPPGEGTRVTARRLPAEEVATKAVAEPLLAAKKVAPKQKPELSLAQPAIDFQSPTLSEPPAPASVAAATIDSSTEAEKNPKQNATSAIAMQKAKDDEQSDLLNAYRSNILKLTYVNTQYPKRALDFKQEGEVILAVTLDRRGKLLDIVATSPSKHRLLTSAARKAVKKSAPFPAAPKGLQGDSIEVSLPFNFQI
jgi:protein TonB